jgi:tripartite-type tricarboxylate transporter receptor subunit TctC
MKESKFYSDFLSTVAVAAFGLACHSSARGSEAENYPNKPIKIVVAFGAGGGTDTLARIIGERLSQSLGQPVVVENKPGAGGSIGTGYVAKSPADGYTIELATSSTHGINPNLYKNLPYDPIADFSPISMVATTPMLMSVPSSLPIKDVQDLIAMAKKDPGKLYFASSGNGTTSHLSGTAFTKLANVDIRHVPYKSAGQASVDLLAGRVTFMFDNIIAQQSYIKAGQLRPLAVTSPARSAILPNVPTLREAGLKGDDIVGWFAMVAPAKTPMPILVKLSKEIARIIELPDVKAKMLELGTEPKSSTPEELKKFMEQELPKWKTIINNAGAQVG